jgi:hypothetical protein
MIFTDLALYYIEKEDRITKKTSVLITDFAVRIGNLPPVSEFGTHSALEAKLVSQIIKVVDKTPKQLEKMNEIINPSQVASIHFGNKNFKEYVILKDIDAWACEG